MESTPEFFCYACQQRAPISWLRFWRDDGGRSRRLCQCCFDGMSVLAARSSSATQRLREALNTSASGPAARRTERKIRDITSR